MKRRSIALGAAVLIAAVAGVIVIRWWHDRPPYEAAAINASVTVDMLGVGTSGQERERVYDGVSYLPSPGIEFVGGHVRWNPPAGIPQDWNDGWFTLFVIDKSVDLMASMVQGRSDSGMRIVHGSDGVQNDIARKYPWLKGAGYVYDNGSYWSSATTVMTTPAAGSITFVAWFPPLSEHTGRPATYATAPVAREDLLIALVYTGRDRQVYWAQRLFG